MFSKIIQYYKDKSEDKKINEFVTRIAAEIEFEFTTITDEKFKVNEFVGIGKLANGIVSAKKMMLNESCINVGSYTYKTDKIVSVNAKVLRYGVIDEKFKSKNNKSYISKWDFMWTFEEDVIEFREFNDTMIKAFDEMFLVK